MVNNPEVSLIALLLNYPEYYEKVSKLPNSFQEKKCRYIFELMKKQIVYNKDTILSIINEKKVFSELEFYEIYETYFEEDSFESYIDFIQSQYAKAQLERYCSKIRQIDYTRYDDIKNGLEKIISDIDVNDEDIQSSAEVIGEMQKQPESICKMIKSGIPYFDSDGGFESTDYVVIAARPSDGKTTYALNLIGEDIVNGIVPGFFTTETNNKKIMSILSCLFASVEERRYRNNNLTMQEREKLAKAFSMLHSKEVFLDGTSRLFLRSLRRKARKMVRKHGVQKLYIDYIQRIQHSDKNLKGKYELTTYISAELKALAIELDVPIIALAQLNRENEKNNREPRKSDLKNSGDIEQDADIIILLHHKSILEDGITVQVDNIVDKNRNGPKGRYMTFFNKQLRRIRHV
jgi:replicative DNA helicase